MCLNLSWVRSFSSMQLKFPLTAKLGPSFSDWTLGTSTQTCYSMIYTKAQNKSFVTNCYVLGSHFLSGPQHIPLLRTFLLIKPKTLYFTFITFIIAFCSTPAQYLNVPTIIRSSSNASSHLRLVNTALVHLNIPLIKTFPCRTGSPPSFTASVHTIHLYTIQHSKDVKINQHP